MLICIDPGHGGADPGAIANGVRECDTNLAIGLRLRDRLVAHGFRVIMTRTTDRLPMGGSDINADLSYRAALANRNSADLFLSIHADSGPPAANGVAAWIYPGARGTRTETIAHMLVDSVAAFTGQLNRGVRDGDFCVLRETTMDAVLMEMFFITNPDEARLAVTEEYQSKAVEGLVNGICRAFGIRYVPLTSSQPPKDELADAVAALQRAGIISSPEYWLQNARPGKQVLGEYAAALILKVAKHLKGE